MKITDNNISLDKNDVKTLCKPGENSNTCVWLLLGSKGFECSCYAKPTALVQRYAAGQTVSKRNGCDEVKKLALKSKPIEAKTLADFLEE